MKKSIYFLITYKKNYDGCLPKYLKSINLIHFRQYIILFFIIYSYVYGFIFFIFFSSSRRSSASNVSWLTALAGNGNFSATLFKTYSTCNSKLKNKIRNIIECYSSIVIDNKENRNGPRYIQHVHQVQ